MITRENLKDIVWLGLKDDYTKFYDEIVNHEYVHVSASFFNGGTSVTLTLIDDLYGDWSELAEGGNDVFLETNDPIFSWFAPGGSYHDNPTQNEIMREG